jgi:hypothetical protein
LKKIPLSVYVLATLEQMGGVPVLNEIMLLGPDYVQL